MHALNSAVHYKKLRYLPNINNCKMDYRQKMVVPISQKYKNEDDEDEDLEALRLAALKSLRAKPTPSTRAPQKNPQHEGIQTGHSQFISYNQRFGRREFYNPNRPSRQNGIFNFQNVYHPSRNNQNLIEIIPVEENTDTAANENKTSSTHHEPSTAVATEDSKFQRYKDDVSGSDEEDQKESGSVSNFDQTLKEVDEQKDDETGTDKENQIGEINPPVVDEENDLMDELEEEPEEEDEKEPEDDDDILLMADLEEEDSLERLMDEMEREMNVEKSPTEKKEKKPAKKDRESKKLREPSKLRNKNRLNEKIDIPMTGIPRYERKSVSPYGVSRTLNRHRSLSPKPKSRKKSPRRSPQRQMKKSQRDLVRPRSPRKSPPRYSPRPRTPRSRSPCLSPLRSPNRSPIRKLSPRGRSSRSRSPLRLRRSRSPKVLSRSRSPRFVNRARSPPRTSPGRSPPPRSPKGSPHRLSPIRRMSPRRSRSPRSPRRSPRRSPQLSPRRPSPRRSPPRRSPWSSPRNSPRLSPRRRRSSPKERKRRSVTPEETLMHKKENSLIIRTMSPDVSRAKIKPVINKEMVEVSNDPVLEARRRKFESTKPIDPVTTNKKIKLSKKEETKIETTEIIESNSPKRNARETIEEYEEIIDEELPLHEDYDFDDLEEALSNDSSGPVMCVEVAPIKIERERVKKKKKKDKELYQVGKLKDSALSGRIIKEKKCKKRKEMTPEIVKDEIETLVEEPADDEADLRTELSRRRAERLNRTATIQSARLLQSAFKGVVNEVAKNNAKVIQRHQVKGDEKAGQKGVRRVTVLHRTVTDLTDSDESVDSKVPVRFRLGLNKPAQETHETKVSRKSSKRPGRKGKV